MAHNGKNAIGDCSPENDSVWGTCREAQEVAALRAARNAARLKSAALELGRFQQNANGQWVHQCPDCRQTVTLRAVNGDVHASSSGQTTCPKVPRIQQWLRDNGFQS